MLSDCLYGHSCAICGLTLHYLIRIGADESFKEIRKMHFGSKPKFRKLPWGRTPAGGKGVGAPPLVHAKGCTKKPRSVAGFFGLERLFLVDEVISHLRNEVVDLCETTVETRLGRVYALLQSLEASGDRDSDVVAVLVDDTLDEFEVAFV